MMIKSNRLPVQGSTFYRERAVSPVVGVMLMLVVTIIIAAVVSGFAGGLINSNSQKVPTISMDVKIINSGSWRSSEFSATVNGVSNPIPTKDLKILTSWTTTIKANNSFTEDGETVPGTGCIINLPVGSIYHGGAEILPGVTNSFTMKNPNSTAPYGFGAGVGNISSTDETVEHFSTGGPESQVFNWQYFPATHFGNYTLVQGTVMMAEAGGRCIYYPATGGQPNAFSGMGGYGAADSSLRPHPFVYSDGNTYRVYYGSLNIPSDIVKNKVGSYLGNVDGMQAILGCGWENLRQGDSVNMKIVHIPSGNTIFDKDVIVSSA